MVVNTFDDASRPTPPTPKDEGGDEGTTGEKSCADDDDGADGVDDVEISRADDDTHGVAASVADAPYPSRARHVNFLGDDDDDEDDDMG